VPELPDVEAYVLALRPRVAGTRLLEIRVSSPFLLRTVTPAPADLSDRLVTDARRQGKRVVLALEGGAAVAIHLMVAGRLHWAPAAGGGRSGRRPLAAFRFSAGTLTLTEAGTRHRAALHLLPDAAALAALDRGGVEPLAASPQQFEAALRRENHTLKRALTDPRLFSGIGNAYSDEILHRARLSPFKLSAHLLPEEVTRLHTATVAVLTEWRDRLAARAAGAFPERVTAFHPEMAVHGRFGLPCPHCGAPVQRIVYAENESNYCAACQSDGRVLADRALSRLLKEDWPRTLRELEERLPGYGGNRRADG
jgi:formamidopyrimidine-DNA glycosylase